MAQCDYCGKSKLFGHTIQYNNSGKWALRAQKKNRAFEPNIQKTRVMVKGVLRRVSVCTRCLRTMQKV